MATSPGKKKRSVPREKTGVLGLLRWMREKLPYFDQVLLRDYAEDEARVVVFAVLNGELAPAFSKAMKRRLAVADDQLDEERRLALREVLKKKLAKGPRLLDVELSAAEHRREDLDDFDNDDDLERLPAGAFLFFQLLRKTVQKVGDSANETAKASSEADPNTDDDPASDAGAPRYVVLAHNAPDWVEADSTFDFDPDWPLWVPNPGDSNNEKISQEQREEAHEEARQLALLLDDACQLLRPTWPKWPKLAADLRSTGHTLMGGGAITESGVRRIVIAAEQLLGNKKPDILL
jgi:hypothetical protein